MSITKTQAKSVVRKMQSEASKLQPSSVLTFFEIDLTDILFERGSISSLTSENLQEEQIKTFRFHNNINLINGNIIFQGNTYYAMPIQIQGLEVSGSGTLPTPTLSLSTIEEASNALSLLKCQIAALFDLVGAKITIKRTFLKHIDSINFAGKKQPDGYDEDQNAEFTPTIFYVDRKIEENKVNLKYELRSIFDLRQKKLPSRLVLSNTCMWNYRGEGCCYETSDRASEFHDGVAEKYLGNNNGSAAPPVTNEAGTRFEDILGFNYQDLSEIELQDYDAGEHDMTKTYNIGQFVYTTKDNINYYYVAKKYVPEDILITNTYFWEKDSCTKTVSACKMHFGSSRGLPYGGFPATNKLFSR